MICPHLFRGLMVGPVETGVGPECFTWPNLLPEDVSQYAETYSFPKSFQSAMLAAGRSFSELRLQLSLAPGSSPESNLCQTIRIMMAIALCLL